VQVGSEKVTYMHAHSHTQTHTQTHTHTRTHTHTHTHKHTNLTITMHTNVQDPANPGDGSALNLRAQQFAMSHETMQKEFQVRL